MALFSTSAIDGVKTELQLHSAVQKTPQGINSPDNWRNRRPTIKVRGFFHGENENAQHGRFLTGCVGTPKGVPVPIAGLLTRHSLPTLINSKGAGSKPIQLEAIMPNIPKGNHTLTLPITTGKATTSLNQHQRAIECIDRAKLLITEGKPQIALGQLMMATRSLKQVCGGVK